MVSPSRAAPKLSQFPYLKKVSTFGVTTAMSDNRRMTPEQAATLRRLAEAAYELDAFKSNLTRAEADNRIAALTAKLKLLDGPPHTL